MERNRGIWYEHMEKTNWTSEFPTCSIFNQLKNNAQKYPDLPAIDFQNKKYSFEELIYSVEKLAAALHIIGIKKGDFVSIVSPNTPQGVFMFYAVNRIGAVANMIYPLLSTNEIQNFVEQTKSSAVFVLDAVYSRIAPIKWNMEKQPKIIIARVIDALPFYLKPLYALKNGKIPEINPNHNNIFWNELLSLADKAPIELPPDDAKPEDLAIILYTGGTTGKQKGVMATNYNYTCYAVSAYEASGMKNTLGKKCLAVLPLFHGFGLALNVHTMLSAGVCIYLVPTFDFKKCTDLIFKKKLNYIFGVPSFFEALSRCPKMETENLSFIKTLVSGGDVLQEKLQRRINKQLKANGSQAEIRNAYGLTEIVTGCCINPVFNNVIGSVGIPCPDVESKVVEPGTCIEVPNGTEGELCLTGPILSLGYFNAPDETSEIIKKHDDGKSWLHTGDIFYKRDDGYLFFRQRIKRMIISSGYNIYMSDVEDVVLQCSIVKQCCAVGVDDSVVGQYVGLYIILNDETSDDDARKIILQHCNQKLAIYSIPHIIVFVKDFPKTIMGKTDFKKLEDNINNRNGRQRC